MKKAMLFAAALGMLSIPALAQQSPTGQSSGGPARVGTPGQIGGGVPGTRPGVARGPLHDAPADDAPPDDAPEDDASPRDVMKGGGRGLRPETAFFRGLK